MWTTPRRVNHLDRRPTACLAWHANTLHRLGHCSAAHVGAGDLTVGTGQGGEEGTFTPLCGQAALARERPAGERL